jgi:hypothetical protein
MMASAVEQKLAELAINNSRNPQLKLGSGPNGEFLQPGTCDNFNSSGRCGKKGGKNCKNCHLVQVSATITSASHDLELILLQDCSAECQKENWSSHKLAYKLALGRHDWFPTYARESHKQEWPLNGVDTVHFTQRKYFWGNLPEYYLLNLAANEGKEYDKDLD